MPLSRLNSAQRLSASRIITLEPSAHLQGFIGAQRLSASRIITLFLQPLPRRRYRVLNAFRHHGLLRRDGGERLLRRVLVLNAFRHHGLLRRLRAGGGTGCVRVLNAFRHHGLLRMDHRAADSLT